MYQFNRQTPFNYPVTQQPYYPVAGRQQWRTPQMYRGYQSYGRRGGFSSIIRFMALGLAAALLVAPQMLQGVPNLWIQRFSWLAIGVIMWPILIGSVGLMFRFGTLVMWVLVATVLYTRGVGAGVPGPIHRVQNKRSILADSGIAREFNNGIRQFQKLASLENLDWTPAEKQVRVVYARSNFAPGARSRRVSRPVARRPVERAPVAAAEPDIDYEALKAKYAVSMTHSGPQSWQRERSGDELYFGNALKQKGRDFFGSAGSGSGRTGGGADLPIAGTINDVMAPIERYSEKIIQNSSAGQAVQGVQEAVKMLRSLSSGR